MQNQIELKFEGFRPDSEELTFLKKLRDEIIQFAPYDSIGEFSIKLHTDKNYHAKILLESKRFSALIKSDSKILKSLTIDIGEKIQLQLHNWKKARYDVDNECLSYIK